MMKRYHHEPYNGIREHPEGELVEWEDHVVEITQLKELNREMVEALQEICFEYKEYGRIMGKATVEKMELVLAKAEGGG